LGRGTAWGRVSALPVCVRPGLSRWRIALRTPVALRLGVRSRRLLLGTQRLGSLRSRGDLGNEFFHERAQRDASLVALLPAPDRDRAALDLLLPEHEHVGDLEELGVPDLGPHLLLPDVGLDPDSALEQQRADLLGVRDL